MTERAGRWLRVSGGGQDEALQVPDVDAWIAGHGYEAAATYTVHGGSAFTGNAKFDRTWAQVLDDMRHGRVTVLVTWKQDRLDRKLNTFQMLAQVVKAGGRVEFVTQPHLNDLTTMGGRIALKVQEEIAYAESKDKSDRIGIAHARIRANGGYLGRAPFGYLIDGPKYEPRLVPDPGTRELARHAFERIAAGASLGAVGGWLAGQSERPWWPSAVAQMIRNPAYRGAITDDSGRITGRCEPLITGQLHSAANEHLAGRPKRGTHHAEDGGLSGTLRCIRCGGPMYRIKPGDGTWRYRCVGSGPRRASTCRNMVRCADMDHLVDQVMARLDRPVTEWHLAKGDNHDAELADIELELRDLPARGLDDDAEDAERARLRAERKRLSELPATPDRWEPRETGETYASQWRDLAPAARRDWLKRYAPRLYAGKTGMEAALLADPAPDDVTGPAGETGTFHTGRGCVLAVTWRTEPA